MVEIIPSILSADFARLADEIERVEQGGVSMLHVDVMDGHFVPNITIGPPVVRSIRKATRLALDVHLMIADPDRYAPEFISAGADCISVHQETCPHLDRTIHLIQGLGARAGVVINPATPVSLLEEILPVVDYVLLMSVNPGFGGQAFIPRTLEKVRALDRLRRSSGLGYRIEIDGGISKENLPEVVRAGCDWIVTGSSVFHTGDPGRTVAEMRQIAAGATAVQV
jgi:ribulose-phosphate 3-epimerase